jgi:hypothetical protein
MSPYALHPPASFRRIFVGGVPRGTTEPQLREAFASAGTAVGCIEFVVNGTTGVQRGFAFVDLLHPICVAIDGAALARLHAAMIAGRGFDIQGIPEQRLRSKEPVGR